MITLLKRALRVLAAPLAAPPAAPPAQGAASGRDRMARDVARRPDIHWMMYR